MNEQLVQQLMQKLEVVSSSAFNALLMQVRISAIAQLVVAGICFVCFVVLGVLLLRTLANRTWDDDFSILMFSAGLCFSGIFAGILTYKGVCKLVNPVYYAIKELVH